MKMIFGSHNYNLNTEKSDIDTLLIKTPSITELYDGTNLNSISTSEDEDIKVIDIREIVNMFDKPNMFTLEYFSSVKTEFTGEDTRELYEFVNSKLPDVLRMRRGDIALRLIAYMKRKIEESIKSSEARDESIAMYGYDVKSLYAFFRNDIILTRLLYSESTNVKDIIWFEEGLIRDKIVSIKTGDVVDYDELYSVAKRMMEYHEKRRKEIVKIKIEEDEKYRDEYDILREEVRLKVREVAINRLMGRN